ncbi:MAG: HAD family phosphatase [Verrucomicrobia bacterium]|nr:HAD family phosphatase [Verrucomicrobiota bacterium]
MIRALIFDFDGLILDTESALIAAYADVHAAHGVAFDPAEILRAVGHHEFAFDPWHAFPKDFDRDALEAERTAANRVREVDLKILPGVVALLDAARAGGLRVGLASNSSRGHCERHLTRLGLIERFHFLSCRGEAPSPKPEPDLYNRVLAHFGLRGHEAIAFEDSPAGSTAAKRAHCHVVVVPGPTTNHHDFAHADLQVGSLAELTLDEVIGRFERKHRSASGL